MSDSDISDSDAIPEQLLPVRLLDTSNRRTAAGVYCVAAAVVAALVIAIGVELMWLTAVLPLLAISVYQFIGGRHIQVTDMEAIEIGSGSVPFEVGHGSATLGFIGFTARPVWQILLFESGPAPEHQALVTVDALSGDVTGIYVEDVATP